ncbi:MAG: HupE/UreJ family protein [Alphaproteobacteria bacterium]
MTSSKRPTSLPLWSLRAARAARILPVLGALSAFAVTPALAHGEHGPHGVAGGMGHVVLGLDHLAAMVAVGMLAVGHGGRGLVTLPLTFLGLMAAGLAAAWFMAAGGAMPPAVSLLSVFALGALILGAGWLRTGRGPAALFTLVGVCGVIHGWAHGTGAVDPLHDGAYVTGIMLAGALLHGLGILFALSLRSIMGAGRPTIETRAGA